MNVATSSVVSAIHSVVGTASAISAIVAASGLVRRHRSVRLIPAAVATITQRGPRDPSA